MSLWKRLFGPASPDRFAGRMIAALRRAGIAESIEWHADDFKLTIGPSNDRVIFLDNTYREYCLVPRSLRAKVIERFARSMATAPDFPAQFEQAREHLCPGFANAPSAPRCGSCFSFRAIRD